MKDSVPIRSTPSAAAVTPASCPSCHSPSIVTNAKIPDVDSYWRCTKCGNVWNASRARTDSYGGRRWR